VRTYRRLRERLSSPALLTVSELLSLEASIMIADYKADDQRAAAPRRTQITPVRHIRLPFENRTFYVIRHNCLH
jgi:hypothetical protein